MNKINALAGSTAVLLALTTTSRADIGLSGAVGLPLNPTAELPVLAEGQVSYRDLGDLDLFGVKVSKVRDFEVQSALAVGSRGELDLGYDEVSASDPFNLGTDGLDQKHVTVGGKYLLTHASGTQGISTAIGVGYDRALFRNTYGYLVATKPLALFEGKEHPAMVSIGVRRDHWSLDDIGGPSSSKWSAYSGFEMPLLLNGQVEFVGEIGTKNNDLGREKTPYSYGLRGSLSGGKYSAGVGYQRQGVTGDGGIYFRVQINTK